MFYLNFSWGTFNTNCFFFSFFLNFSVHGRHTLVGHALPGPTAAHAADASEETEEDDKDERREDVDVRRLQTALPCLDQFSRRGFIFVFFQIFIVLSYNCIVVIVHKFSLISFNEAALHVSAPHVCCAARSLLAHHLPYGGQQLFYGLGVHVGSALFFVFCSIGLVPNDIDSLVNVCACPIHKGQCEGKKNKDCETNFHFVAVESYPCKDFRKAS